MIDGNQVQEGNVKQLQNKNKSNQKSYNMLPGTVHINHKILKNKFSKGNHVGTVHMRHDNFGKLLANLSKM